MPRRKRTIVFPEQAQDIASIATWLHANVDGFSTLEQAQSWAAQVVLTCGYDRTRPILDNRRGCVVFDVPAPCSLATAQETPSQLNLTTVEKDRLACKLHEACVHLAFYRLVLEQNQCGGGAWDGACLAVAHALRSLLGGTLCIVRSGFQDEHIVLKTGGDMFWDGFGRQDWQALCHNWRTEEGIVLTSWRPMEMESDTDQYKWGDVQAPLEVVYSLFIYFFEVAKGWRLADTPLRYFVIHDPEIGPSWAFTALDEQEAHQTLVALSAFVQRTSGESVPYTLSESTEVDLDVPIHNDMIYRYTRS